MCRLLLLLAAWVAPAPHAVAEALDIRGAWHPDTYILEDGTRHPVRGLIVFTDRDWSVVFLVTPDGRTPQRGSGEAGTYSLTGNRLVFSHLYNLSGGGAVQGIPESPFEMNLHAAGEAPSEACTVERTGSRMTIRFPSGNAMEFERATASASAAALLDPVAGALPPIVGQVTFLYFNDIDAATRFYGETLGLTLLWENVASIRFRCGEVSELSTFRRPSTDAQHTLAHFEVADIEATVRELEARGVEFVDYTDGPLQTTGHIAQLGPARGAWFRDPDGNFLGLRQG